MCEMLYLGIYLKLVKDPCSSKPHILVCGNSQQIIKVIN